MVPTQMLPSVPDYEVLQRKEKVSRESQKRNFDHHHKARPLKSLAPGQRVWIVDMAIEGTVKEQIAPRSYLVTTAQGTIRRNRRHLKYYQYESSHNETAYTDSEGEDIDDTRSDPDIDNMPDQEPESDLNGTQRTRSGRISRRPDYFNPM